VIPSARPGQYALLGADYMLDMHGKLWLIELNPFPVMPHGKEGSGRWHMFTAKVNDVVQLLHAWKGGLSMLPPEALTELVESGMPAELHRCAAYPTAAHPTATGAVPLDVAPLASNGRRAWPLAARCAGVATARVALGFYGMARALQASVPTLHRAILAPLAAACVDVDVYVATNLKSSSASPGTRKQFARLLRPVRYVERSQGRDASVQALLVRANATNSHAKGRCRWIRNYTPSVMANMLEELASLAALTDLWEPHAKRYRAVIFTRPDLHYVTDLHVARLLAAGAQEVHTPRWHSFLGTNNRIAYGEPFAMQAYGRRLHRVAEYLALGKRLNAEEFLRWVLETEGLQERPIPIVAQRLREAKATVSGSASSAVASVFWYDMCLSAACASLTGANLCAWDCRYDYKQWQGWPDCVGREDS